MNAPSTSNDSRPGVAHASASPAWSRTAAAIGCCTSARIPAASSVRVNDLRRPISSIVALPVVPPDSPSIRTTPRLTMLLGHTNHQHSGRGECPSQPVARPAGRLLDKSPGPRGPLGTRHSARGGTMGCTGGGSVMPVSTAGSRLEREIVVRRQLHGATILTLHREPVRDRHPFGETIVGDLAAEGLLGHVLWSTDCAIEDVD